MLNTVAIWFFDIVDKDIVDIANILLKRLKIELRFGEYIEDIGRKYVAKKEESPCFSDALKEGASALIFKVTEKYI